MPNDPENNKNINPNGTPDKKDDFVDSSFLVQFKPGDKTESVADKLKESKENLEKQASLNDGFRDEFDDFEFDSSISAFKPFKAPEEPAPSPAPASTPAPAPAPAPAPEAKPVQAAAQTSNDPVFPKDGGTFDKPAFTPKAPEPPKEALPKFDDKSEGAKGTQAKPADDKLFKSGNGLDFATSEHDKKTSPFMNAEKPVIPEPDGVDIPRAEKQKPIPPTSNSQQPAGYRPYPSAAKQDMFAAKQPGQDDAKKAEPAKPAEAAKPVEAKANEPAKAVPAAPAAPVTPSAPVAPAQAAKPVQPAQTAPATNVAQAAKAAPAAPAAQPSQTATQVPGRTSPSDVVPAKAPVKSETAKPAEPAKTAATAAAATAATAAVAATAAKASTTAPAAAPSKPVVPAKPAEPAKQPVKPVEKVKAPAETEKPHRPAATAPAKQEAKAAPAPAPAPAPVKPVEQTRPGTTGTRPAAQADSYSPFEPKSKQPAAATRGVATNKVQHHDTSKNISPVTTVNKPKKKKKERKAAKDPGLVGLITFLAIIIVAIGVLWALDNTAGIRAIFGKKQIETIATVTTTEKEVESSKEENATAATTEATTTTTEATTEATTESTTEATTEATTTTTEATTEATTTTTTEATTEATTTTTTEATTRRTSAASTDSTAAGIATNDFGMKITRFTPTAGGFKFDIELKNKSNHTASLTKSLKYLDMKLYSSSTITEVTSDAMTFTGDGRSYRGIPNEISIAAGETYTYTVYVSTSSSVTAYGYDYAYFKWV